MKAVNETCGKVFNTLILYSQILPNENLQSKT